MGMYDSGRWYVLVIGKTETEEYKKSYKVQATSFEDAKRKVLGENRKARIVLASIFCGMYEPEVTEF